MCLRLERKQHVTYVLGEGAANAGWRPDLIPPDRQGALYLHAAGATTPMLGRAFEVPSATIDQVARRYAARRPSLDLTAQAATDLPPAQPSEQAAQPGHGQQAPAKQTGRASGDRPGWSAPRDPEAAILEALADAGPGGVSVGELRQASGMSRSWIYNKLRELTAAGTVEQASPGRWRLTTPRRDDHPDGRP